MKKQIITIISVALAAILLFGLSSAFNKGENNQPAADDPYTTVPENAATAMVEIQQPVSLVLYGYEDTNSDWEKIFYSIHALTELNGNITMSVDSQTANHTHAGAGFKGVCISANGKYEDIPFSDFFLHKKILNKDYGFNGFSVVCNSIFRLCGMPELEISPVIYDGFDENGNVIVGGASVFVFPEVKRAQIAYLTVVNDYGSYDIYQSNNSFYFGSSRAVSYEDEAFAQLTTNCRYVVAVGQMEVPADRTFKDYGLEIKTESSATADEASASLPSANNGRVAADEENTIEYTLVTTTDSDGYYAYHTLVINKNTASSGSYHYARYIGGLYKTTGNNGEAVLVENLSSDTIFFLSVSTVASLMLPETDLMKPNIIINTVSDVEELYNIGNIRIDYYKDNITAAAKNISAYSAAPNLSAISTYSLTNVILDKKYVTDYSKYESEENRWQSKTDIFAAFTSSDGKDTYITGSLARQAENGEYKVEFGLLRDEECGAYLPANIRIEKSYDGINWHEIENGTVYPSQADKTVARYSVTFTDSTPVTFVRVNFGVPQKAYCYVVFDEIRIYANGEDAQPSEVMTTRWKLVSPSELIHEGYNYANLDMTNFNTFVQSVVELEGEKVVACGFSDNSDASPGKIKTEILAKYGLDNPEKHFSYEYNDIITDLYISAPDENGIYYAYSTFTGEIEGEMKVLTTDVIVQLTNSTADWIDWEFNEFIDHSLVSLYVVDMDSMEITLNGTSHKFLLAADADATDIESVSYNNQSMDVYSFKALYRSVLGITMQDEYDFTQEDAEEYLRIKITSESDNPELVFYKVSATRCYYTVNGEGGYYVHADDVAKVIEDLESYISGEKLE